MKHVLTPYTYHFRGMCALLALIVLSTFVYPKLLYTAIGQLWCAFLLGLYMAYVQYNVSRMQTRNLRYSPSGTHKEKFDKIITDCGIDSNSINLRYSFCAEGIAAAIFNTLCIDPLVWHGIENDPPAQEAQQVIKQYIEPTLTDIQKKSIAQIKNRLGDDAQRFIIKHEVGHIYYNYSYKKIGCTGITGAISGFLGFFLAGQIPTYTYLAPVVLMVVISISNAVLHYASNIFFTLPQEIKADYFAIKHSSIEECQAAAGFFQHVQHQRNIVLKGTFLNLVPTSLLTGHPQGFARAAYIRNEIIKKESAQ